jgi:hypothetical protein
MPWNETDREKYAVIRERYASNLSDETFALGAAIAARSQVVRT